MTKTSKAVLSTGWSAFLGFALLFAVYADVVAPVVDLPDGKRYPVFGAGSALLGWLVCVLIPLLPALVYRELRDRPLHKGIAVVWWLTTFFILMLILSPSPPSSQPYKPSFVLIGSLFLSWRLLTWKVGQTEPGVEPAVQKTFYFRRGPSGRIEGPGPMIHIRAHLMKHGGFKGVEYVENTGIPIEEIPAGAWKPALKPL